MYKHEYMLITSNNIRNVKRLLSNHHLGNWFKLQKKLLLVLKIIFLYNFRAPRFNGWLAGPIQAYTNMRMQRRTTCGCTVGKTAATVARERAPSADPGIRVRG